MYEFERILVKNGFENNAMVERAKKFCQAAEVILFDKIPSATGGSLSEKIFYGKKLLRSRKEFPLSFPSLKRKKATRTVFARPSGESFLTRTAISDAISVFSYAPTARCVPTSL